MEGPQKWPLLCQEPVIAACLRGGESESLASMVTKTIETWDITTPKGETFPMFCWGRVS